MSRVPEKILSAADSRRDNIIGPVLRISKA
jgi:hypothetical protein